MSGLVNKVKDALSVSLLPPPTTARGYCAWCRTTRPSEALIRADLTSTGREEYS